ncbi:MAG TPA: YjgN family protein [Acetobacteraceae bacterium]
MDQSTSARSPALSYDGQLGELYGIFLMNLLWTVLTLGIFRFWAITRIRRYLWSRTRFQGERFEYTGTGGELFVGVLLAILMLIGAVVVSGVLFAVLYAIWHPLGVLAVLLLYGGIFVVASGAVFSAQRYKLSRTTWAGIRGGMTGSMLAYGLRAVLYGILAGLTLFQMLPWRSVRLAEQRINASSLGNLRFRFRGRARDVYGPFLLTLLGGLLLLVLIAAGAWTALHGYLPAIQAVMNQRGGAAPSPADLAVFQRLGWVAIGAFVLLSLGTSLISLWYVALFERHVIGRTSLGPLRFSSTLTGRGLLWLSLVNMAVLLVTLGLGFPVALQRTMRFLARNLWVSGALDLPALQQGTAPEPRLAEGLFQVLDGGGAI